MENITLTPGQTRVYDGLLRFWHHGNGVATLKGYAGVGKTTVTASLVAAWIAQGLQVLVTASTNKAVAVLVAKMPTGVDAMTIHSALGLKGIEHDDGRQSFVKDRAAILSRYDVCVVDESSMLQDDLFAAALSSRHGCKLLFVGDPAQLAPVQEGGALSRAFDSAIVPIQMALTEVLRQAAGNPIIRWAHKLREWVDLKQTPDLVALAAMLQPGDQDVISIAYEPSYVMQDWAANANTNGLDVRILAFTNKAVTRHNACVHARLFPGVMGFAPTEPVMFYGFYEQGDTVVRNSAFGSVVDATEGGDQSVALVPCWNLTVELDSGDVVTVPVPKDQNYFDTLVRCLFNDAAVYKAQAKASTSPSENTELFGKSRDCASKAWSVRKHFAQVQHAYAITIHKSQGSTFETVLLDWNDLPHWRNDGGEVSRMVYVAITRSSNYLAVFVK